MRDEKRQGGRFLVVMAVLVGLSAGAVYWKRVVERPDEAFQEGLEAYSLRAFPRAATAWQEADSLGHLEASHRLAGLYLEGHGVERNHRRAFELYEKAAKAGRGEAQLELARLYDQGRGTTPDMEQAVLWYWSAAKNEVPAAQLEVGRLYEQGRGVEKDLAEAASWYGLAAQAGVGDAQLALGLMYLEGRGVDESIEAAASWLQRAAEDAQLPEAWYHMGTFYEKGLAGYPRDHEQAAWCYGKAAEAFHTEGLYRAGRMALTGRGVKKDAWAAVSHFRQASAQGHVGAMYELGRAFEHGDGARRSRTKAEEWYGKAAAEGHVEAMAALQELGLDSLELSRYERRRLEKKREKARAKRESEHARKMAQVGRCEVYTGGGPVVEMRTRMDCLNRGGTFQASDQDEQGSFSTDDGPSWDSQRRQLNRRRRAEARKSRSAGYGSSSRDVQPLETDWVVCYSRGSRDGRGYSNGSCSSAMRKTSELTTSWCRERGYDGRRLFKHASSARSWRSKNCR